MLGGNFSYYFKEVKNNFISLFILVYFTKFSPDPVFIGYNNKKGG